LGCLQNITKNGFLKDRNKRSKQKFRDDFFIKDLIFKALQLKEWRGLEDRSDMSKE